MIMNDITRYLTNQGADLVGFADLTCFATERRMNLPFGIAIALAIDPKKALLVMKEATQEYYDEYEKLNETLDRLGLGLQDYLQGRGFAAVAQTVDFVKRQRGQLGPDATNTKAPMPQKTVAALAGLGWIGKNTLLITEKYGSAVRLTSVLTDAPFPVTEHTYTCRCGDCQICKDACPGGVIKGAMWTPETDRDELIDFYACRRTVVERGRKLGITHAACGICMAACPHTQKYLRSAG